MMHRYSPQPRFNYNRLRNAWWSMPLQLTFATWLTTTAVVSIYYLKNVPLSYWLRWLLTPDFMLQMAMFSFPIALAISLLGLVCGVWTNFRAKAVFGRNTEAGYLPDWHPLTQRVHRLADELNLPHPRVGLMPYANAYAVGSSVKRAAVIIGQPLVNGLNDEELDAIIGHELGHIATGDVQRMQFAVGFQNAFHFLFAGITHFMRDSAASSFRSNDRHARTFQFAYLFGFFIAVLARRLVALLSELLVKRLSRVREYHADAMGAALTSPEAMSSALSKLEAMTATAGGELDHFVFFGKTGLLFSTHPTTRSRQKALHKRTYLQSLLHRAQRYRGRRWTVSMPSLPSAAWVPIGVVAAAVVPWYVLFSGPDTPKPRSLDTVSLPIRPKPPEPYGDKIAAGKTDRAAVSMRSREPRQAAPSQAAPVAGNLAPMVTTKAAVVPPEPSQRSLQAKAMRAGLPPDLDQGMLRQLSDHDFENARVAIHTALFKSINGYIWPSPARPEDAVFTVQYRFVGRSGCRTYVVTIEKGGATEIPRALDICDRSFKDIP